MGDHRYNGLQTDERSKPEEILRAGLGGYYAIWDKGIFPSDSNGVSWTSTYINTMGDPIADLHEDMAAEQKSQATPAIKNTK